MPNSEAKKTTEAVVQAPKVKIGGWNFTAEKDDSKFPEAYIRAFPLTWLF